MKKLNLPKSWNELNNEQFCDLSILITRSKADSFEDLVKISFCLSGLSESDFFNSDFEDFEKHKNSLKWIQNVVFEKQFFPQVKQVKSVQTLAFKPGFEQMEFSRWGHAYKQAKEYLETQSLQSLVVLVSILFSKEWNWKLKDFYPQFYKAIPERELIGHWVNYLGHMNLFKAMYPEVFSKDGDKANIGNIDELDALTSDLTGAKFGMHEDVRQTDVHEIFTYLELNKIRLSK